VVLRGPLTQAQAWGRRLHLLRAMLPQGSLLRSRRVRQDTPTHYPQHRFQLMHPCLRIEGTGAYERCRRQAQRGAT
jgi:hypothetical protein